MTTVNSKTNTLTDLVAARVAAEDKLTMRLLATEAIISGLVEAVNASLEAANDVYNAGPRTGRSSAVRDTISTRIQHRLRVECGLTDMEQSLSPTGRTPLGEAPQPRPAPRGWQPPRDRKDIHDPVPEYPGQNPSARPIIQSFLRGDDGEWVEVAPGGIDLPSEPFVPTRPETPEPAPDLVARHQKADAEARALKQAAARIRVPGESTR